MDVEERRKKLLELVRRQAQEILDDPNSDQLARDLAHLRLQHDEEGTRGFFSVAADKNVSITSQDVLQEWLTVEANEIGLVDLDDYIRSCFIGGRSVAEKQVPFDHQSRFGS
jgi:hypothetical protein